MVTGIRIAIGIVVLLTLAACSKEESVPMTEGAAGNVRLELTLDTREANDSAIGNETYIHPDDIHVFLFEQKDGQWNYYDRMSSPTLTNNGKGPRYTLTGTIYTSQAIDLSQLRFVVLANLSGGCPLSESSSLYPVPGTELQPFYNRLVYNYGEQPQENFTAHVMTGEHDPARIPMWGVATPQSITPKAEKTYDLGSVNMLRAMAKIEVKMSADLKDKYELLNVELMHSQTSGMLTPRTATGGDASGFGSTPEVTGDMNGKEELISVNIPTDGEDFSTLPIRFYQPQDETGVFYLICPELPKGEETDDLQDTHTNRPHMHVRIESLDTEAGIGTFPLFFATQRQTTETDEAGNEHAVTHLTPFDVLRNHHYVFTITGVESGLQYKVEQWEDRESNIEFN